jgi:LAO/AO transport system kinase
VQQKKQYTAAEYISGILNKDRIMLSKAITVIESSRPEDAETGQEILQACLQLQKQSRRIGISGAPGAGKSTFINTFGKILLDAEKSVAVLAVDPSSTISKGSILGDKTRMETIVNHPGCFVRPTASSNALGGVARHTRETMLLCEAFGFDYILIETVGVGQSETMVKNMTDLFVLLLLPNSGDELQGIKRGIMEMADIVIINKSDKGNESAAKTAAAQVNLALHLYAATEKGWTIPVLNISSTEKTGFDTLLDKTEAYFLAMENSGFLKHNRQEQQLRWFDEEFVLMLKDAIQRDAAIIKIKQELESRINSMQISPSGAAKILAEKILKR